MGAVCVLGWGRTSGTWEPKFPPSKKNWEVRGWFGMGGIKDFPIPHDLGLWDGAAGIGSVTHPPGAPFLSQWRDSQLRISHRASGCAGGEHGAVFQRDTPKGAEPWDGTSRGFLSLLLMDWGYHSRASPGKAPPSPERGHKSFLSKNAGATSAGKSHTWPWHGSFGMQGTPGHFLGLWGG